MGRWILTRDGVILGLKRSDSKYFSNLKYDKKIIKFLRKISSCFGDL